MICKEKVAELLPWYVNDTLSKEERERVAAHLKVCPICQKSLKALYWFSNSMERYRLLLPVEHIDPEKLAIYAESKSELTSTEIVEIEEHLAQCLDCQEELDTLLKVGDDLKRAPSSLFDIRGFFPKLLSKPKALFRIRPWERLGTVFGKFMLKPVIAYILVLILLYPAWIGLRSRMFEQEVLRDMGWQLSALREQSQILKSELKKQTRLSRLYQETSSVKTFELQEDFAYRGSAQQEQQFSILVSDHIIRLAFFVPISDQTCQYNLDLYSDKNLVLSQKNVKAIDNQCYFSVFLSAKTLTTGQYELKVTEICLDETTEFPFSFKISKQ